MLFNSYEFIFLFLPITITVFFGIGRLGYYPAATGWLVIASLFFYAWWNPAYLGLLVFSVILNYATGLALNRSRDLPISRKFILIFGITVNLLLLGYYKYANFFVTSINDTLGTQFTLNKIVLPLAISFFTFQQISYLVDAYKGKTKEYNFLNYCLFVCFFPQLIAGPIVHHKEMIPQFLNRGIHKFSSEDLAIGLTIFSAGLFKKTVLADNIAHYATPIFIAASNGASITFYEAWIGALAYTLQLYFDFSGYSDMAIGSARMFGIKLPLNFNSPYKSVNISEFWRRWHMTLTRFLRDYVSIPLSRLLWRVPLGNKRQSKQRQLYVNIMVTMLLSGLWHGAGWNYVFWGGLHGAYLVIYQQWREFRKFLGHDLRQSHWWSRILGCGLTFICGAVSLVFFRAANLGEGFAFWQVMFGANGISLPGSLARPFWFLSEIGVRFEMTVTPGLDSLTALLWIGVLLSIVWLTPNTQQWMARYQPTLDRFTNNMFLGWYDRLWNQWKWEPTQAWAIVSALTAIVAVLAIAKQSEFLYFQF